MTASTKLETKCDGAAEIRRRRDWSVDDFDAVEIRSTQFDDDIRLRRGLVYSLSANRYQQSSNITSNAIRHCERLQFEMHIGLAYSHIVVQFSRDKMSISVRVISQSSNFYRPMKTELGRIATVEIV